MNKKILLIILSAIVIIALIATVTFFVYRGCKAEGLDETTEELSEEDEVVENVVEETTNEEEASQEKTEETVEEEPEEVIEDEEVGIAPTIELKIYEGPLYSQADSICYYRIEATATGTPAPTIKFSKDDSNGSLGVNKAQVNLSSPTDSYSLTATATNSVDSVTSSIDLNWGCNNPPEVSDIVVTFTGIENIFPGSDYEVTAIASDPEGNSLSYSWNTSGGSIANSTSNPIIWSTPDKVDHYDMTVVVDDGNGGSTSFTKSLYVFGTWSTDIPVVSYEGGWIEKHYNNPPHATTAASHSIGDTFTNHKKISYLSFDISGLHGITVTHATLTMKKYQDPTPSGEPSTFLPGVIGRVDWGDGEKIVNDDYYIKAYPFGEFTYSDITCSAPELVSSLQNDIDSGRQRFQIVFSFTGKETDNDNAWDAWIYNDEDIRLNIIYYE